MTNAENIQKAIEWRSPEPEHVVEIRFGSWREYQRLFTSNVTANLFRSFLRDLGMSYDVTEREIDS